MFDFRKAMLLAATVLTASCDQPASDIQPADNVLMLDFSSSGATDNRRFTEKAGQWIARDFLQQEPMLGDRVMVFKIGSRDTDNDVPYEARLDRQNRPPAAAQWLYNYVAELPDNPERSQGSTHILHQLLHGNFQCSTRGKVWIVSDALESSETFSDLGGLLSGSTKLPVPEGEPLKGCRIAMIGVGLTARDHEQLTSDQIAALISAWREWFITAGVAPENLSIVSGI